MNMLPEVKADILAVLDKLIAILQAKDDKDALEGRELSRQVIHDATLFEEKDAISVAVFVYGFSKIMQRMGQDIDYQEFSAPLSAAAKDLEADDLEGFRDTMRKLFRMVSSRDEKINLYVSDVLRHARIKHGSNVCEHGMSCAKSAQLLDVSQWELMQYLGKTTHSEQMGDGHDIRSRLQFARGLFS